MDVMQKEKDHNKIHQNMERWFKFNASLSGFKSVAFTLADKAYTIACCNVEAIMIQVHTNVAWALQKGARHLDSMKLQCNDSFSANSIV